MKKLFAFALMGLVAVLMSIGFTSCHHDNYNPSEDQERYITAGDSCFIVETALESVYCQNFDSSDELLYYSELIKTDRLFADIVCNTPPERLKVIARTIISEGIPLTKRAVVNEYLKNKNIYDNIPVTQPIESKAPVEPCPPDSGRLQESVSNQLQEYSAVKKGGPSHE